MKTSLHTTGTRQQNTGGSGKGAKANLNGGLKKSPNGKSMGLMTRARGAALKQQVAAKVTSGAPIAKSVKKAPGTMMRPRGLALLSRVVAKNTQGAGMVRKVTKLEKKYGPFNEV